MLESLMSEVQHLKLEEPAPYVLKVTLNRPEVANAANTRMSRDVLSVFEAVTETPERYRCIILTGAGERAFCAGGDLKERDGMTEQQWRNQHYLVERMVRSMINCPVTTIAAVNGAAYAGGLELALCCDFIYASQTARFALTEVTRGIMPGAAGTQNLARAVGERRAKEIIITGRPFSAEDAYAWGMVNQLCPPGELNSLVMETANCIASNAPLATRQAKHAIHYGLQMDARSAMMFEIEAYNRLVVTEDRAEGVRAFVEKRKPNFQGC